MQNLEATLVRLGEEAVGLRLTVERLLSCLGKPCRLPPTAPLLEPAGSGASPTPPRLPAPSLPAVLRPHLRWIMRAIHLMREPTVLAWLLVQKSSRTALGLAEEEAACLAEAASALFDPLNPGDERRQRAAVEALCALERLPHLASPDFAAVGLPASAPWTAPWPSPLLRHLLAEHLCRLPSARRFLHRSLSGVLETFLDAIAAAEMDAGGSSNVDVSAAGEDGAGAGAGSALLSACEKVLGALTNHAAALPSALLVICASLGGARHDASLGGARHDASLGGARNDASLGVSTLAAELLILGWIAPAVRQGWIAARLASGRPHATAHNGASLSSPHRYAHRTRTGSACSPRTTRRHWRLRWLTSQPP